MDDDQIAYKELVEIFLSDTVPEIAGEYEVPKFNIIFDEEAYQYFYYVLKHPYGTISTVREKHIKQLMSLNGDDSCPTIVVKDFQMFFYNLLEIINRQIRLYALYEEPRNARDLCMFYLRRVWLRMTPGDFCNVEKFLDRELSFIKNYSFDYLMLKRKITEFYGNDLYMALRLGTTFDESTRQMTFFLQTKDKKRHDLPYIHYGVTEENGKKVCYIFGVQNDFFRKRIPKVERTVYKLNQGISEENVHPSRVLVLKLFLEFLRKNGITHIKVPLLHVLNYRYHEIYSEHIKDQYKVWDQDRIDGFQYLRSHRLKEEIRKYENAQIDYIRFVDKQDLISKLKTENLIQLFMEMLNQDSEFELVNDLDNNDGCLDFRWSQKIKTKS